MASSKAISGTTRTPTNILSQKPNPNISHPPRISFNKSPNFSSIKTSRPLIMAAAHTYYDVLEVPKTGTLSDIKRAYKKMALKYHPDVSPPGRTEENTQRFLRVQEAYRALSDPKSRAMYDAAGYMNGTRSDHRSDEEVNAWRSTWMSQITELKKRSMANNGRSRRATWGARIRNRKQRGESGFS